MEARGERGIGAKDAIYGWALAKTGRGCYLRWELKALKISVKLTRDGWKKGAEMLGPEWEGWWWV